MNATRGHPRSRLFGNPEGDPIELSRRHPLVGLARILEERAPNRRGTLRLKPAYALCLESITSIGLIKLQAFF